MDSRDMGGGHPQRTPTATAPSPILFLDTNGIHYARLALSFVRDKGLRIGDLDLTTFTEKVRAEGIHRAAVEKIVDGYHATRYLAKRVVDDEARVRYAPVSGLELRNAGLRSRALLNAAKYKVPNRWYSRLDEAELLHHLEKMDFTQNESECAGLASLFRSQLDFEISESDERDLERVFYLSSIILSVLFLELGDCLVYATALLARASEVITADAHLNCIIAGIENPGGAKSEYRSSCSYAREVIQAALANLLQIDDGDAIFPKALTVRDIKQKTSLGGTQ